MRAIVLGVLCGVALCGCAAQRAAEMNSTPTAMVGMSKEKLLACAGAPLSQESTYDMEFLSYPDKNSARSAASKLLSDKYCMATVALRNGYVKEINYQARDGTLLDKKQQCAFLFDACTSGNPPAGTHAQ